MRWRWRWIFSIVLSIQPVWLVARDLIECEGEYGGHLQGVAVADDSEIFWSFTTTLVKTGLDGKVVRKIKVVGHSGDLCVQGGRVYVAVNLGEFNREQGKADSLVYVYDAESLRLLARHPVPEVVHGAGGMYHRDGFFYVVGGLPEGYEENYVYQYDPGFNFIERHVVESGYTLKGIQTACFHKGYWWFGCYGEPRECLKAGPEFDLEDRFVFDCALGIDAFKSGYLVAEGFGHYRGRLVFFEDIPGTLGND